MNNITGRPFYEDFAWAYDLIIDGDVSSRCQFIEDVLVSQGIGKGSQLLDAGCGTGNYTLELGDKGYKVTGLDMSKKLLAVAREKVEKDNISCRFIQGDITKLEIEGKYDGIICRGVLNDIIDDTNRDEVFKNFAQILKKDGVLIFDVRDWEGSKARKTKEPVFEKKVTTNKGELIFYCKTKLNEDNKQLEIMERHTLKGKEEKVSGFNFTMKCWTMGEIKRRLTRAGLTIIVAYGGYDFSVPLGSTDRMVVVASLKD